MKPNSLLLLTLVVLGLPMQPAQATSPDPPAPPSTPVRDVRDNYFGTSVVDPYRWLEDSGSPEVSAWMKAQNEHARAILGGLPDRESLFQRIRQLDNTAATVSTVQRCGERLFYLKNMPGNDYSKLYVRDGGGKERLLVDPEKLTRNGTNYPIDGFSASFDGKYLAYALSPSGSFEDTLHVIDVATGRPLGDVIDRMRGLRLAWRADGRSFFYVRGRKLPPNAPPAERLKKMRAYLHVLGTDPERDLPVFGHGMAPDIPVAEDDVIFVSVEPGSSFVVAQILHIGGDRDLYAAAADSFRAGAPNSWSKIVDVSDEVRAFSVRGDDIFLLSHKGAPHWQVLRMSLAHPDRALGEIVVPQSSAVTFAVAAATNAVYVLALEAGMVKVSRVSSRSKIETLALPSGGSASAVSASPDDDRVLVLVSSWTRPPRWFQYSSQAPVMRDAGLVPPPLIDTSRFTSVEVKAKAADGTPIPLSIVYQRGMRRNGSNPTWLMAYGSYGVVMTPSFAYSRVAWLERGGIYAVAHVRGGGENGEDWHQAARLTTKSRTVEDFIACAEYLIQNGYTSPAHLAVEGRSGGGIPVGGMIVRRPELIAAAVDRVPVSDLLRMELSPIGPSNTNEFGSVKTAEGFRALYAVSSYHQVKNGTRYPAVLLTTGIRDTNVSPFQPAKMAARLQAATASAKPVLLRIDYDSGHVMSATKLQRDAEMADIMAFLFWQLGGGSKTASASER